MGLSLVKIQKTIEKLWAYSRTPLFEITDLEAVEVGYKKTNTPPTEGYLPFEAMHGAHKHYFIKGSFRTPACEEGYELALSVNTGITGWDATNPQFLLYLNGQMVAGLDVNHTEIPLLSETDYEMYNYAYSGIQTEPVKVCHTVTKIHRGVEALYYDLLVPFEACRDVYAEDSGEYRTTLSLLDRAVNRLDLRYPGSREFYESVALAREFFTHEFYEKVCSTEGKPIVNCIGHTHIDVEWRWTREQTREKIQRSFATAKALMDKYPEYKFMLSQPELYRYLKEEAPEKYEELRALVKEGRWEPEGAMYLECDCNLVSGESFVRQILYGQRFFREEFGKESHVLFLPDVFGYSAALPQILKKSGIDHFVTSKISWNDTNTVPYDQFLWQGIDGTEIHTSFITGQHYNKKTGVKRTSTYVGQIDPAFIYGTWARFSEKEYSHEALNTFGFGDGGGGPTAHMLEEQRRLAKGLPGIPVSQIGFLYPYLQRVEKSFTEAAKELRRMPKWIGELYLEYHRGTYTTMAENKKGNRKAELGLAAAEALSYTDLLFGGSYDKEGLDKIWRKVLHNQFHDILPGSSIHEVYEFTAQDYKEIEGYYSGVISEKLRAIASKVKTRGGILVYNPTGFARLGTVRVDGVTHALTEPIPAFGYRVLQGTKNECAVKAEAGLLENDFLRIRFDDAGRMVSVYDKRAERELIRPGALANEFVVWEDHPVRYDAWELDEYAHTKAYVIDTPVTCEVVEDGARRGLSLRRAYHSSTICETVWLSDEGARADLEFYIDWHEKHQVLKLVFPFNVHARETAYEIQFGHVLRQNHKNTSWDQAKFEVSGHKWVDLSEGDYGVAVLNDCKYGYSVEESTLSLTCLRSPDDPNPTADEGEHTFTYAILPHSCPLAQSDVIKEAYALNQPLLGMKLEQQNGTLPDCFGLVSIEDDAVILESAKRAENSDDLIVRLYESKNTKRTVKLTVSSHFQRAVRCDLMERELEELKIENGTVTLALSNFEIETVKLIK